MYPSFEQFRTFHSQLRCAPPSLVLAAAAVALLGASGCSAQTRYYTLSRVDAPAARVAGASAAAALIAIGPVSLPDYVDRPQIVVRTSANTVEQAAFDQWGGSLDDMVPNLLVDNLAARLPADRFVSFPQAGDVAFDYRVPVTISQFDVSSSGQAVVAAQWQVRARAGAGTVVVRQTIARDQAAGAGYADRVAALSRAVSILTDEIAAQLATLPRGQATAKAAKAGRSTVARKFAPHEGP